MKESKTLLITSAVLLGFLVVEAIYWGIIGINNLAEGIVSAIMFIFTAVIVFLAAQESVQKARKEGVSSACDTILSEARGVRR